MEKNTSKKEEADMNKPCIEYICACAWCEVFGDLVQVLEKEYEGKVHVKIYRAGKDFDYIPKYRQRFRLYQKVRRGNQKHAGYKWIQGH